jgi:hypothetical protein
VEKHSKKGMEQTSGALAGMEAPLAPHPHRRRIRPCCGGPIHEGVAQMIRVNALRWAGVAIVDMATGFLEGLRDAPRIFFAPLVGVRTEIRRALVDLDAKHARQTSGRV